MDAQKLCALLTELQYGIDCMKIPIYHMQVCIVLVM